MANTKHVTLTVTETATITREVEVTEEELQKIRENDSPILNEIFCELDYAKDADREFNYSVDLNESTSGSTGIRTATTINPCWSEYDQTVASCHLANYGIIFLDEYDYPIDNEYRLEDLNNEYVNQKCKSQLHQSPKTSVWAVMREIHQNDFTNRYGDTARPFSELVGVFQNESDARKVQEDLINENAHDVLTYDCDEENIILEEMELQ